MFVPSMYAVMPKSYKMYRWVILLIIVEAIYFTLYVKKKKIYLYKH